jgi:hypothetical protein
MRAINGPRRLHGRRRLTGILAASLLAVTMLGGTTLAAQPVWQVGHGTLYTSPTLSGASSSSVSAGNTAGFFEWLHNQTSSNISQLYMNATVTPNATLAGAVWTIKGPGETQVRNGTCAPTSAWVCSFGALNSGETVYVTLAFTISSAAANGVTESLAASFNATGTPPGKNQSHGDVVPLSDSILVSKNGDAAGDFNFLQAADFQVADAPVGGNNKQSTSLSIGGLQIGAAVGDSPSLAPATCNAGLTVGFPSWFQCSLLTSLTSAVEVGNGKTFQNTTGGPGIKVIVTFSKAPGQLSGANPFVYHYYVDAAGAGQAELVTAPCTLAAGGLPTNSTPCLIVGSNKVTVWLFHNGNARM